MLDLTATVKGPNAASDARLDTRPRWTTLSHEHAVIALSAETGTVLRRMEHLNRVQTVQLSLSGLHVLVTTEGGRSFVWSVGDGAQLFEVDERYARAVWLSDDRLAIRKGKHFEVEAASHDTLMDEASSKAGTLTQQEWQTYLPDEPWPGELGESGLMPKL